jgi:hypothetical protein
VSCSRRLCHAAGGCVMQPEVVSCSRRLCHAAGGCVMQPEVVSAAGGCVSSRRLCQQPELHHEGHEGVTEKNAEFHLRALRALRGNSLSSLPPNGSHNLRAFFHALRRLRDVPHDMRVVSCSDAMIFAPPRLCDFALKTQPCSGGEVHAGSSIWRLCHAAQCDSITQD